MIFYYDISVGVVFSSQGPIHSQVHEPTTHTTLCQFVAV
jgi:hypothetical protein